MIIKSIQLKKNIYKDILPMAANVTNSIPTTLNELLVKLKFISLIERGKKVNINANSCIDRNSWIGSFWRSLSGEGRKGLMLYLISTINQAITAINEYNGTEFKGLIVNHLAGTKPGLSNLLETYGSDLSIISQISVLISNIDIQLEKNRELLDGHRDRSVRSGPIEILDRPVISDQPPFGPNGVTKSPGGSSPSSVDRISS